MSDAMSVLVLQLGIVLFAVRLGGALVKRLGIPPVLGELLSGVAVGPYALGGIAFPGFPHGIFPLGEGLAVSSELYAFATVASIILLFSSGLETDLGLFLRYSIAGGVIGMGGVIFSFVLGAFSGAVLLDIPLFDPRCLFLGILSTATSVGITARILSDQKKMDSPEGVTILAAAVFDDVLGIIALAVVLGIIALLSGNPGDALPVSAVLGIAGKAFGIWLGFTALGLIFSKQLARFLKLFRHSFDFSILALGIALILAGFFEKQGLAMIIGAYIAGLSLSKTDIATVIQERIHGLYAFFVPVFFAVMGMMVNVREFFSTGVLVFGVIYTAAAICAKVIGCGGPALLLGFNRRGALRIGAGMVPRGEVALIIAGIGLASGILDTKLFSAVILMTLVTTLAAPPLLNSALRVKGNGTRKPVKGEDTATARWEFPSDEVADLVMNFLLRDLRAEGFYVQMMNVSSGISHARKDDIALSINETGNVLSVETAGEDLPFVKTAVYEVILSLNESLARLGESSDPKKLKRELAGMEGRARDGALSLITEDAIITALAGNTKEEIIAELVDLLDRNGKLIDRNIVLEDVLQREKTMSTGMEHGIALPHAKTGGVSDIAVAVGIKKDGVDFDALDGEKSRLFVLTVSPKKTSGPHVQFLSAVAALLQDGETREAMINAVSRDEVMFLLRKGR
ncbi:MAG: cation:proton antiporter [Treponema sp.]|jgi:Kef-type K+ transport system membrane component KefB/mannitol/fructose-specific phosphotransferase system IIA component (Ntr-type)|nr:cation:proton antiporter [Treponema sp.]